MSPDGSCGTSSFPRSETASGCCALTAVAVFAMGLLLGLDPLVAQAYGARRIDDCHRWLIDGLWLSALISIPLVGCVLAVSASLPAWGIAADVLALAQPYLTILAWTL